MAARITVNGVTYENVDAMPPDVRQLYDQSLANVPELAHRDAEGIPDLVKRGGFPAGHETVVRKKFIVNGQEYDDMNALPPDVRQAYDTAMRSAAAGGPAVKHNEIKISFQLSGPGISFRKTFGNLTPANPPSTQPQGGSASWTSAPSTAPSTAPGAPMPEPIEPATSGSGVRIALIALVCAAAGIAAWLLLRGR